MPKLDFKEGDIGLGAGIGIAKGKSYTGHIVLQGDAGARVQVALIWGPGPEDRRAIAIPALEAGWQSYPFEFVAGAMLQEGTETILVLAKASALSWSTLKAILLLRTRSWIAAL